MIQLSFNNSVSVCILTERQIKALLIKAVKILKLKNIELELNIVSDYILRKLNRDYRGINKTTDVLAFAWQEDKKLPTCFLGQIYVSYSQIVRQSKYYQVTIKEEIKRMIIHGLLHLLGYDHKTKHQANKMFSLQEEIIK